jgi:hypothetical protein
VTKQQKRNITPFVKRLYLAYFKMKLGDQDKKFAPHVVCKTCAKNLRQWSTGLRESMPFGIPMVWCEQKNHYDDCYFCLCKITGFNKRNKEAIIYPNLESAIRPVSHGPDVPIPTPPTTLPDSGTGTSSTPSTEDEQNFPPDLQDKNPHPLSQAQLNDLVRDLGLSKEKSELLGSRLKENNLLGPGTLFSWYRHREQEFTQYFVKEGELVYCCDISGLITRLGAAYESNDWRLFIDSSKRSLKGVLLHNGNKLSSVPITHSMSFKEKYEDLGTVLEKNTLQ